MKNSASGVAQKERLKMERGPGCADIDGDAHSRTLHMSLTGLRDGGSSIESAPDERLPVQTYVVEYRPALIASAIRQEIERGGQVYFVFTTAWRASIGCTTT